MELTNEFVIDRPVADTWKILNDLEFIAPCMPGAQLTEIEGEEYRGMVKIKVGPITANYKGKARFVEQDEAQGKAVLRAEGRDPRQGNANALVTATMQAASPSTTNVQVHTELSLSGKIASFGRGAIEDVSKKILGQFTDNLRDKLGPVSETAKASKDTDSGPTDSSEADSAPSGNPDSDLKAPTPANEAPAATPGVRKIDSPEAKPLDILQLGSDSITPLQKALPFVGAFIGLILLRILFGRRGSS